MRHKDFQTAEDRRPGTKGFLGSFTEDDQADGVAEFVSDGREFDSSPDRSLPMSTNQQRSQSSSRTMVHLLRKNKNDG